MNFLGVPLRNDLPWYRFTMTLSGVVYTLHARYNTRMQRWLLDICDAANNNLIVGIPVLIERDLTGRFVISGIPAGTFFAVDFTGNQNQPDRYAFGISHQLIYADPTS